MASERETDPRVYEVSVALADFARTQVLTSEESRAVIDGCEAVRRQATRWRLMLGAPGRLLVTEPGLAAEIRTLLGSRPMRRGQT